MSSDARPRALHAPPGPLATLAPTAASAATGPLAGGPETTVPLTILLVEDNPGDAELLREYLLEPTPGLVPPRVLWADRLADARARLAETEVDVALLDLSLPDARGLATVELLRAAAPSLPIVVLTGHDDEALAVQAVQAGAQDYLVKGHVTTPALRRALRHAVERHRLLDAATRATHARDMVLGVVAHDLRNPLSTIKMCAGALGASPEGAPAQVEELAGVIRRSAEWMEHIIRDLLDVTAIEAGRLAVDVAPLAVATVAERVRELHAPIAVEKGVAFAVRVAADTAPTLVADIDRLLQALGNLVGNALKFTPAGGEVALVVAPGALGVRFAVVDTGPGIAAVHLPHVFDRFWQARETRRAGAGLGLAIVKGIVEAHGGALGVESTVGRGSTFWLELPAD